MAPTEPQVTTTVERPKNNASTAEWAAFAVANGVAETEAAELSRSDIIERFPAEAVAGEDDEAAITSPPDEVKSGVIPGDGTEENPPQVVPGPPRTGRVNSLSINNDGTVRGNPLLIVPEGVNRQRHIASLEEHTAGQLRSLGIEDADAEGKALVAKHIEPPLRDEAQAAS